MSIFRELKRRNVIKVAIAYAVVAWLLIEVTATVFPILKLPDWSVTLVTAFILIGFPLALILAWAFEITPEGIKLEKDVDRSQSITHITGRNIDYIIIAALVLALSFFAFDKFVLGPSRDADLVQATTEAVTEWVTAPGKSETAEKSIAVLPFVNMSDDPGNEYFSDGISEELLNVLIKVEGLRVVSRTSSFAFKGKDISIPEIARKLNVDHVLEGSVRKAGNTVRVTAQLIDVRTDSHLWSGTYDRELEDIFAIQDEIAGQIVQALKIALGAGQMEAMVQARNPTENLAAYELYLRGRYAWQRRAERDNLRRAIGLFQQATKLDPQFARAWSSLAAAHTTLPDYSDAPAAEQYPLAVSAAHKALMLDDSLAEAYAVLGDMARVDRKWEEAEAYYLRAIASEPKNSTAHVWYGEYFVMVGRLRNALEQFRIAYQLDPLHPVTNKSMAAIYFFLGDNSNALKYGAAAWDLGHGLGLHVLAMTNLRLGEFERAIELAEQYDKRIGEIIRHRVIMLRLFFEAKMDTAKRPMFLEKLAQNESVLRFRFLVSSYSVFGRIDDAYRLVNMHRDPARFTFLWIIWQPDMAVFRQDPRFAGLMADTGLVDYWRENGWPDACQPAGDSLICE
ncbi:MAG: tetratricopeptide repeat protein [Proteobacteria bacterium]|nr:tetratricopeptide repeat protein [Pseudomonadota bacterium]